MYLKATPKADASMGSAVTPVSTTTSLTEPTLQPLIDPSDDTTTHFLALQLMFITMAACRWCDCSRDVHVFSALCARKSHIDQYATLHTVVAFVASRLDARADEPRSATHQNHSRAGSPSARGLLSRTHIFFSELFALQTTPLRELVRLFNSARSLHSTIGVSPTITTPLPVVATDDDALPLTTGDAVDGVGATKHNFVSHLLPPQTLPYNRCRYAITGAISLITLAALGGVIALLIVHADQFTCADITVRCAADVAGTLQPSDIVTVAVPRTMEMGAGCRFGETEQRYVTLFRDAALCVHNITKNRKKNSHDHCAMQHYSVEHRRHTPPLHAGAFPG
jgi:hypothetical protein